MKTFLTLNPVFTHIIQGKSWGYAEPRSLNLNEWRGEECHLKHFWFCSGVVIAGSDMGKNGTNSFFFFFYAFSCSDGGDIMGWRTFIKPSHTNYPLNAAISLNIVSDQVHPSMAILFKWYFIMDNVLLSQYVSRKIIAAYSNGPHSPDMKHRRAHLG